MKEEKNINLNNKKDNKSAIYNILLVDDDKFLLDMYSMKFTQEGNNVQSFRSSKEALSALRGGFKADAVVFDLVMPEQDGFEFIKILKNEKLATNAILVALTNQGEDEERKKTEELGADAYIVKASTIPSGVVSTIMDMVGSKVNG
jgi:CheY-like chemotaxis protein